MEGNQAVNIAEKIAEQGHDVVILTPYNGQKAYIASQIIERNLEINVQTVDGYQGKECDFVILSLVRNNDKPSMRRWGFVSDARRLNVALSRAREGLVVITSIQHLEGSEFGEDDRLFQALNLIVERGTIIHPEGI